MSNVRQILFIVSPALRRALYFDPLLYGLASVVSFLLLITRSISIKNLLVGAFFLCVCGVFSIYADPLRYIKYLPLVFFLVIHTSVSESDVVIKHRSFVLLFLLVACYSIYQNYFGFLPWDISFLQSGVGNIGFDGYSSHIDIRPFSVFSGLGEATFFYLIASVIFFRRDQYILFLLAISLALISGSRGLLACFVMSMFMVSIFNKQTISKNGLIWWSLASGALLYAIIFMLAPLLTIFQGELQGNRLAFWGSMGGRIHHLLEFFTSFSYSNLFSPLLLEQAIYDNILLTMVNDFGCIIAVVILFLVYGCLYSRGYWERIFFSTLVSYGFFADQILSIYLLAIFSFGIGFLNQFSITHRSEQ